MGTLNTINIKHASSSSNNIVLNSDGSTTFHSISNQTGKIIQYKTAVKLDTLSTSSTSYSEISTDLRVTITPIHTTSKIIAIANLYMFTGNVITIRLQKKQTSVGSEWAMVNTPTTFASNNDGNAALYAANNPLMVLPVQVIETAGSVNERYYSPHWRVDSGTGYLNLYNDGTTAGWYGTSTMTVMEVAA